MCPESEINNDSDRVTWYNDDDNNNNDNNNNNNNNNNNEKILLTTMLTIKILFTINSLEKKKKTIHSKTLFTIPADSKKHLI